MLKLAYDLARDGRTLEAARECARQFAETQSMIAGVEGMDFFVLAGNGAEALALGKTLEEDLRHFFCRVEFFRALALWDGGQKGEARAALQRAWGFGYDNIERFKMEWGKRVDAAEIERLLMGRRNAESRSLSGREADPQ
jgi:hypothetical protein